MSGGLNEAFADMTANAAQFYISGNNDWMLGGDAVKASGSALRYMDDPPRDGRSIHHQSQYTSSMDVHYTSGVFNKAFYLLSTTEGWNTKMAWITMATANLKYWSSTTTWDAAGSGVIDAACDLGHDSADVENVLSDLGINSQLTAGKGCNTG